MADSCFMMAKILMIDDTSIHRAHSAYVDRLFAVRGLVPA
jgi:hypothetical protein